MKTTGEVRMTALKRIDQPVTYQIEISGMLSERWAAYFGNLTLTTQGEGKNQCQQIVGQFADQAALLGFLHNLSSLGYFLVSVRWMPSDPSQND